ncbi:hypothetical protein GCM10009616_07360 [Microlunatus lacustris]
MGLSAQVALPVRAEVRLSSASWKTDPVVWATSLFLATFLLQRIAVPGLPVPITVPLAVGWVGLALLLGVVDLNRVRAVLWLTAAGLSGLLVTLQMITLVKPFVSVNSWALWIVMWLPLVVQLRERDRITYLRFARTVAQVGLGLAALSLLFLGSQVVGIRYHDWLSTVVPQNLLVQDYIISYPITYGSPLYKSNGWIALEPSFMSFFLGVALICALLAGVRVWQVLFLGAGLLSTVAGSGIALVGVFLLALAVQGRIGELRRYLIPGAVVGVLFGSTVLGEAVLSRVTEAGESNSSTSLRSVEPYVQLWPHWLADPVGIFIGHGPGSSANVVAGLGIDGLLVPSVAKLLYDYGLLGGALLVALMASTYFHGPSSAFAISLAASMFLIQGAAQPLVICSILLISLWAPTRSAAGGGPRRGRPPRS